MRVLGEEETAGAVTSRPAAERLPYGRLHHDAGGHDRCERRILLVSYHFPPSIRIGALRWQKLTEHFAGAGWAVDVLMVEPGRDAFFDAALSEDLPAGTRTFAIPDKEHPVRRWEDRLYSTAVWVRDRLRSGGRERAATEDTGPGEETEAGSGGSQARGRPDSFRRSEVRWRLDTPRGWFRLFWSGCNILEERAWTRRAAATGVALARTRRYAAVVSSGPPHLNHLAGLTISRQTGLPFVMDIRDAWAQAARVLEALGTPFWLRMAQHWEARAVAGASLVVTTTEQLALTMREAYPGAASRITTVRNGYDVDPVKVPPARPWAPDDRFSIRFAGSIYMGRDPRPLLEGAALAIRRRGLCPDQMGVEFIGSLPDGGDPIRRAARELGIEDHVHVGSWYAREEARVFMAEANILVTLPWGNPLAIPGKLYEYMCFPAWLLALTDGDDAVSHLLDSTGADTVPADDPEGIARCILRRYDQHRAGERPAPLAEEGRFSRSSQALRLLSRLEELAPGSGSGGS